MLSKLQKASDKLIRLLLPKKQKHHNLWASGFGFGRRKAATMSDKDNTNRATTNPIQSLYDLCKRTFSSSSSSSPHSVRSICSLLDAIGPSDVGLQPQNPDEDRGHGFFGLDHLNRVARWSQPITFLDIFESHHFTMCIFCFPTSSVIPLHDHPGMTVFSKILYGSLHVKAYDWVEPAVIRQSKGPLHFSVRLAKLVKDEVLTAPCEASVLYPKSYGNLHCFTAVTPCAVLDVLTPPYREAAGRRCTYYHDYPFSAFLNGDIVDDGSEEDYAWLAEVKTPDNLYMRQGKYVGPIIQV